jgi:hypothetical protein
MSLTLPITPTSLPQGFCPASYQEMWNEFAAHGNVVIPNGGLSGISVSATKPTDQSRPWLQLDEFGRPIRLYWFASGSWLSLHPLPSGSTIWWFDTLPNLNTFDGGDASAESAVTGPMWRQAKRLDGTLIAAQFPIVAGTLPSTTVLANGDVGGEENHVLLPSETNHFHGTGDGSIAVDGQWCIRPWSSTGVGTGAHSIDTTAPPAVAPVLSSGALGTSDALATSTPSVGHNTMPLYVVGYLLQRTPLRKFYSVPL